MTSEPRPSSQGLNVPPRGKWLEPAGKQFPISAMLFVVVVLWGAWSLTRPVPIARQVSGRELCCQNFHAIGEAFEQYHRRYGSYPPAYLTDAKGRPQHSWRVLLLPFLGEQELYDLYRFDEPWNSRHNAGVIEHMPLVYRCPKDNESPLRQANVAVVTGPGTLFEGARRFKRGDITDGANQTLLVVEVANTGYPWTAPRDLTLDELQMSINTDSHGLSSHHPRWMNALLANGRAISVPESTSPAILRALCTPRGGDKVDPSAF